jgi:hypothetical protein
MLRTRKGLKNAVAMKKTIRPIIRHKKKTLTWNVKFVKTCNGNEYQVFFCDFLAILRSAGLKMSLNWSIDIRPYFWTLNRVWTMLVFTCESSVCLNPKSKWKILEYWNEKKLKPPLNQYIKMFIKGQWTYLFMSCITCITSPTFPFVSRRIESTK